MESCCDMMKEQLESKCEKHPRKTDCPDVVVIETSKGLALPIRDGGDSFLVINFCPWCAKPVSKN